jgi:hypothetical protein
VPGRVLVASCLLAIFAIASLLPSLHLASFDRDDDADGGCAVSAAGPAATHLGAAIGPASADDTADDDDDDSALVPATIDVRPADAGITVVTFSPSRPRRASVTPRDLERGPPRI